MKATLISSLLLLFLGASAGRNFTLSSNYDIKDFAITSKFEDIRAKYKPLDFGEGAPDFNPPDSLKNALAQAALSNDTTLHQYIQARGLPRLTKAVANFFSQRLNKTLKPGENVLITIGASEALYSIFQAFSEPNDEWIVFEPYYMFFIPMIKAARALPKFVPLRPKVDGNVTTSADFTFDRDELRNAFNEKTKGILINTPHNPLGKMFTMEELTFIAELAKKWDVLVICDEVYQFLNYDGSEHIRLPTFPGMFDRTITVGSAGKMFCATGYRVGWIYGPKNLIENLKFPHLSIILSPPAILHEAVAIQLENEIVNYSKLSSYISTLRRDSEAKRNYLYKILSDVGIKSILPQGGYFAVADLTSVVDRHEIDKESGDNVADKYINWLIKNLRVYGIPLTYGEEHKQLAEGFVRLTIIKDDETLRDLEILLQKWKKEQFSRE